MTSLNSFSKFAKPSRSNAPAVLVNNSIAYTRVSSKEQFEHNMSLATQKALIDREAAKLNIPIVEYFGGTYESAKTDGRKEFQRMLNYIAANKGRIKSLFVYSFDRFSRTGGGAIKLKDDLLEQYGINVISVTQPIDTSNPNGSFQQDIHLIFSKHDNVVRRQRTIINMRQKFEAGIWVTRPPQGYEIVRVGGERKIRVNDIGKKIRKAFEWKAEGMKNEEIVTRLRAMGVKMYKQQLTKILQNPFYSGIINHSMLDGKVVEGKHERLISQALFLKINGINEKAQGYGVPHKKEDAALPLKNFIRCGECGVPFTGYVVKAKNLWYYKCNKTGCRCNRSAKLMHDDFVKLLEELSVDEDCIPYVEKALIEAYHESTEGNREQEKIYTDRLKEVDKKIDAIEEKFYALNEMTKDTFQKLAFRYAKERDEISLELGKCQGTISNLEEKVKSVVDFCSRLPTTWLSSEIDKQEKLQKLIFPTGIFYDRKKQGYRTENINPLFVRIAQLQRDMAKNEKGDNHFLNDLSPSADRTGLEPATSAVTGRHSNRLNYRSFSPFGAAKKRFNF